MTDLSAGNLLSPIERARLSAELLQVRERLGAGTLNPIEQVRAGVRGLELRALLGAAAPVAEEQDAFESAKTFYRERLQGQVVQSVVGPVRITGKGWRKAKFGMKEDALKARLIEHIVEILTGGKAGQRRELYKERSDSMVAFYFIQKEVQIDDELVTAGVTVGEDAEGNLFYNVAHSAAKGWMEKEGGVLDSAWIKPRFTPDAGEAEASTESVADDDLNITILSVVPVASAGHPDSSVGQVEPPALRTIDQATIDRALKDSGAVSDAEIGEFIDRLKGAAAALVASGMSGDLLAQLDNRLDDLELYRGWRAGTVKLEADTAPEEASAAIVDDGMQVVEAAGLSVKVPVISKTLIADYNRATHMGKGRDVNAELASSVANLLTELAGTKYTLDTPEQKAEAVTLVELYAKRSAENSRQDLAAGARNPSWFVTGRSGRDMAKSSSMAQRQADRSLEAYNILKEFRASIFKTLYAMRPAEVKQKQAVNSALRNVADYTGILVDYAQKGQTALAADARKWISPKTLKLLDQSYLADAQGTRDTVKALDAHVAEFGGMVALFGARSGAGKRIAELLAQPAEPQAEQGPLEITMDTPDATIEGASDDQLKAKLLSVAKDFYRGLSHATKDIARRLEKGTYDRPLAIQALKQNRDYLIERARAGAESDADTMARMGRLYGAKSVAELEALYEQMGGEIRNTQSTRELSGDGRRTGPAVANEGARQMGQHRLELGIYIKARQEQEPAAEQLQPVSAEPGPPGPAPQLEIIEYTTKRDKVLRGIIRTDLTLAEAKAIDPYTWKMNGGYFIREKHLDTETGHIPAAAAPVVLSAEQQAEQQVTAERQVEERRQQALASQVQKLRAVADKAVTSGDAGMNADRNTNTARRAGMAASAIAKASRDKAAGQTLNNIADAIEVGAAGMLAKLSSRAQLDELHSAMRRARMETDKGLSYGEQQRQQGRPFSDDDIKNLAFPRPMAWSNRYQRAALAMAKKAPKGNSRLIAVLSKIGDGPERLYLDDEKAAITRKAGAVLKAVGESWDLSEPMEALATSERLARMGVTDTVTLQQAVRELLPHLAERAEEDPVKKAERAIIGQKVGIDFFPTPAHLAQRMARLAGITKDMRVLEPSAGNGNLADAAKADGAVVDVIEISSQLRDILTAKGYNVVATDFDSFTPDEPYQAIVMNPPFSKRQDAAHIMQAFTMLAGGGRLVAIAGEGVFFGQDQKAVAFRDWLDAHGATVETLEGGTFKDNALLAQTGANARLIILKK